MKTLHLLYHELRPTPSDYSYVMECSEFERHCELFARLRQQPQTLQPEITFDDGHRSNYDFAMPILERHGLRARFFITAGWTGQREGYMDWSQLRALHASGQSIGAHGLTHTLLTHCSATQLNNELFGARKLLEDGLGAPITTMSLPGGRANAAVLRACWNAGYTEVFTSVPRAEPAMRPAHSTVGRLNVRSGMTSAWLEQLLQLESGILAKLERQDRIKSAAKSLLGDRLYARLWALVNRQEPDASPEEPPA